MVVWPARRLPYSTAVSLRTVRASQRMGSTNVNYGQNQAQNHVCNRKNNSLNRIGYHFAWRCVAKLRSTCVPCLSTLKWRCVTIWRYYAILRDVTRSHAISCAVTRRVPPKGLYSLCLRTRPITPWHRLSFGLCTRRGHRQLSLGFM